MLSISQTFAEVFSVIAINVLVHVRSMHMLADSTMGSLERLLCSLIPDGTVMEPKLFCVRSLVQLEGNHGVSHSSLATWPRSGSMDILPKARAPRIPMIVCFTSSFERAEVGSTMSR